MKDIHEPESQVNALHARVTMKLQSCPEAVARCEDILRSATKTLLYS